MLNRLLFVLAVFNSASLLAATPEEKPEEGPQYYFSVQASMVQRIHELEFLDSTLTESVIFRPNAPYVMRADISYDQHSFKLESSDLVVGYDVDAEKVGTEYTDIEYALNIFDEEYRVYYGEYQGFYVFGQTNSNGDFLNFPNIHTSRLGFIYRTYTSTPQMLTFATHPPGGFNSLPKTFGTSEYGLLIDISSISGIPSEPAVLAEITNSNLLFFNKMRMITLAPFAGLLGRYATEKYYYEGGLSIGYGLQGRTYTLNNVRKTEVDMTMIGSGFFTAGRIISNSILLGLTVKIDTVSPSVDENEFSISTMDASMYFRMMF